jgi:ArsR family transcriptional regulator, arsenate/arsenite/antimonite-responsive transcriptional repressor
MESEQFHRITKALADPRRYQILSKIANSPELVCGDVLSDLPITAPTLSHHLKELANAGLVEIRRKGQFAHLKLRHKVWRQYLSELTKLGQ